METSTPEIAIVDPNTLSALGLRAILEELIPDAVIRAFPSFEDLVDDTPDMYAHYFVSANVFFKHTAFFLERTPKCIVLASGEQPLLNGVPALNTSLPQEQLVKSIVRLRQTGHGHSRPPMPSPASNGKDELTPREIEVLVLVARGLINKEIADRLHIGLTTVISHRKNITEKLGIKSVPGLAVYAVMHGYVDVDRL